MQDDCLLHAVVEAQQQQDQIIFSKKFKKLKAENRRLFPFFMKVIK